MRSKAGVKVDGFLIPPEELDALWFETVWVLYIGKVIIVVILVVVVVVVSSERVLGRGTLVVVAL